jgi:hypothetical protein
MIRLLIDVPSAWTQADLADAIARGQVVRIVPHITADVPMSLYEMQGIIAGACTIVIVSPTGRGE